MCRLQFPQTSLQMEVHLCTITSHSRRRLFFLFPVANEIGNRIFNFITHCWRRSPPRLRANDTFVTLSSKQLRALVGKFIFSDCQKMQSFRYFSPFLAFVLCSLARGSLCGFFHNFSSHGISFSINSRLESHQKFNCDPSCCDWSVWVRALI